MKNKIAVTTTSFAQYDKAPLRALHQERFEVVMNSCKRKLDSRELIKLCKDAVGIIAGTETLDASTLKEFTSLRVISRCGAGLENVDLQAAKRSKIQVYNTPDVPTVAVSELTVGLILNLLRKVNRLDRSLKQGVWEKVAGNLIFEKKVGIIGFGRIGRRVSSLLEPFGCKLSYYDPFIKDRFSGIEKLSLRKLLHWSDIVSIHADSKDIIIGGREIRVMKKGAWLVNTSRGRVLDEGALYLALKNRRLSGAALDVFEKEPYEGKLTQLENIIITPHIGSFAIESRIKMEMQAVKNLFEGLKKQ